jgi:hypothetical protein
MVFFYLFIYFRLSTSFLSLTVTKADWMKKLGIFLIRTMIILKNFLVVFPISPNTEDKVVFFKEVSSFHFLVGYIIFNRPEKQLPL